MKKPSRNFCRCCGYHTRYQSQKQRYNEIDQHNSDTWVGMTEAGVWVEPMHSPHWKSVNNPRRLDRFIQCAPEHGLLTPHDIKLRHKRRDIRRQMATRRKHLRQTGQHPYPTL